MEVPTESRNRFLAVGTQIDGAMEDAANLSTWGCLFLPLSLSKTPCFGVVGWVYGSGMAQSTGGQGTGMDTNAGDAHTTVRWERSPCQS